MVTRLAELAEVFTLDVCAYAVISNHYHLVVWLDVEKARALSEDEFIARYSRLFKVSLLVERYLDGLTSEAENLVAQQVLANMAETPEESDFTSSHAVDCLQALAKKMGQSFLKGNGLARLFDAAI